MTDITVITAEEEFRAMMKRQIALGNFTVQQMRAYIDKMRDDLTWELTGRKDIRTPAAGG